MRRKRKFRRKKQLRRMRRIIGTAAILGIVAWSMGKTSETAEEREITWKEINEIEYETVEPTMKVQEEVDYVDSIDDVEVEKPIQRTRKEAIQQLHKLGKNNSVIKKIWKNSGMYPENMLIALANNPEMADFVAGYLNEKGEATSGFTATEKEKTYPLFLQWDPRWGYEAYGTNSNIGLSGCGPTCLSMVLYYLTGNEMFTPDWVAAYSLQNGYYVEGTGTSWALMQVLPEWYGITVVRQSINEEAIKVQLDEGGIIICAMREGDFTVSGHFIVIYGYDKEGFKVNDPNCVARSRKRWSFDEIGSQIKSIWSYKK